MRLIPCSEHRPPPVSLPSHIRNGVFIGGSSDASDLDSLESIGIRVIVNCAPETRVQQDDKRFTYHLFCMEDRSDYPIDQDIPAAVDIITQAVSRKEKVLVHCHRGISRSVSLVIAWLMKTEQLNFDDALAEVTNARPIASPNLGFTLALQALENSDESSDPEISADEDEPFLVPINYPPSFPPLITSPLVEVR